MLCQHCNANEATTHVKRMVNGVTEEAYLCPACVKELGYEDVFSPMEFSFGGFLGNFLGASAAAPNKLAGVERCKQCGSSYNDIVSWGKVGCDACYEMFYDKLIPSIENLHGKAKHVGKTPRRSVDPAAQKRNRLEELKQKLDAAVRVQNFEQAAQLRDEIKQLETE